MSLSQYDPGQELSSIDFSGMIGGPLSAIVDAQAKAALSTVDFVKSVGFTPDTEDETTGEITPGQPVYVSFRYPKMVAPYIPEVVGKVDEVTVANAGTGYTVGDVLSVGGINVTVASITGSGSTGPIDLVSDDAQGGGYDALSSEAGVGGSGSGAVFNVSVETVPAVPAVFEEMKLEVPILTMMPMPFIRVEEGDIDFHAKITSMEYKRVGSTFKLQADLSTTNTNTNQNYAVGFNSVNYNKNVNTVSLKTSLSYQRNSKQGHKIDKTFHLGVKVKVTQDEMPEGMEKLLGILEDAIVSQPTL